MLLGVESVVQTPSLRAFETNERWMAKFSDLMDPCFVGRNAAVQQYMQFAYVNESIRRRKSNTVILKPRRFEEEWAKMDLAPTFIRG